VISLEMAGKEFCWWSGNGKRHFDAGSARPLMESARNSAASISGSMRESNFIAGCIQTGGLPWIFQFPMNILVLQILREQLSCCELFARVYASPQKDPLLTCKHDDRIGSSMPKNAHKPTFHSYHDRTIRAVRTTGVQ
jgi:hypothetical protein